MNNRILSEEYILKTFKEGLLELTKVKEEIRNKRTLAKRISEYLVKHGIDAYASDERYAWQRYAKNGKEVMIPDFGIFIVGYNGKRFVAKRR